MKWKKTNLYDDQYPWAIKSVDKKWIIAVDIFGNTVVFNNSKFQDFIPVSVLRMYYKISRKQKVF